MGRALMVMLSAFALTPLAASGAGTPISPESLLRHVSTLSGDDYFGRAPGTPGETLSIAYISRAFRSAGLRPWRQPGWTHRVPLRQMTAQGTLSVAAANDDAMAALDGASEFAVQLTTPAAAFASARPVFAGHGIVAPEFGRDDYAGLDVRGRVVLVLAGEPAGFPTSQATTLGAEAFAAIEHPPGTYHRWLWIKQWRALERGAAAVLIVLPEEISASRRQYFEREYLLPDDASPGALGWAPPASMLLSGPAFARLAGLAGTDAMTLRTAAATPDFHPRELDVHLSARLTASAAPLLSHNVVGAIHGSGTGCVVLTAHWDGYGTDPSLPGDHTWNGAVDDAGGIAQLIEIAQSLRRAPLPRRSIVFVATTGEERGFLGSRQFLAAHGCKGGIAAVLNVDWFWELGRTARLASHGLGYTSLDPLIARLAHAQGREVTARNAYFAGGDQLPFLLAGIPGFHGGSWGQLLDRPKGFDEAYARRSEAGAVLREGNSNRDEVSPDWDLRGAVQDAELIRDLAVELANARDEPCWRVDTGFAAPGRRCRQ